MNQDTVDDAARYEDKPLMIIIENYILDTIGQLQKEQLETTQKIVISTFGGGASPTPENPKDWREILRNALGLSEELDQELIQMWEKNQQIASEEGAELTPVFFARMIVDDNFADLIQ